MHIIIMPAVCHLLQIIPKHTWNNGLLTSVEQFLAFHLFIYAEIHLLVFENGGSSSWQRIFVYVASDWEG